MGLMDAEKTKKTNVASYIPFLMESRTYFILHIFLLFFPIILAIDQEDTIHVTFPGGGHTNGAARLPKYKVSIRLILLLFIWLFSFSSFGESHCHSQRKNTHSSVHVHLSELRAIFLLPIHFMIKI